MLTLGYFITLGKFGDCGSEMSVLITDLRVMSGHTALAKGHLKGPTLKHCYAYPHSFSGPVAFFPEFRVSNITSAFSLLTALQVQGYGSLGHHRLLVVNSAQCVFFRSVKEPGRNWVWGPGALHRQRKGWVLPLHVKMTVHLLFLPQPYWKALSLWALLFITISYGYLEPLGVLSLGHPRPSGCWGRLVRLGKGLPLGTSPHISCPTPLNWSLSQAHSCMHLASAPGFLVFWLSECALDLSLLDSMIAMR